MSRPTQLLGVLSLFISVSAFFFLSCLSTISVLSYLLFLSVSLQISKALSSAMSFSLSSFFSCSDSASCVLSVVGLFFSATIVILTNGRNNKLLHTLTLFPSFSLPLSVCFTNTQQWFSFLMTTTSHHITLPPQAAAFGWVRRGRVLIHIIDS